MLVARVGTITRRAIVAGGAVSVAGWLLYGGAMIGARAWPVTVYAEKVVHSAAGAPILKRIAKCESPTGQYKDGQVVMVANRNGSVDVGKNGINLRTWGATAAKMGLDLTKERDNDAMAEWIFLNRGTEDWKYSADCWR